MHEWPMQWRTCSDIWIDSSSDFIFDFIENHWRLTTLFVKDRNLRRFPDIKWKCRQFEFWHTSKHQTCKMPSKQAVNRQSCAWMICGFFVTLCPSISIDKIIHDISGFWLQKVFNCVKCQLKWTMNAKTFAANSKITLTFNTTCTVYSIQSVHLNHWMRRNQLNT